MNQGYSETRYSEERRRKLNRHTVQLCLAVGTMLVVAAVVGVLKEVGGAVAVIAAVAQVLGRPAWRALVTPEFGEVKRLEREVEVERALATSRTVVLILRSFRDDDIRFPSTHERFLDVVTTALRDRGAVLAVTDPVAGPSKTGPLPLTVEREFDWTKPVEGSLGDAAHIVVVIGSGMGLAWEMDRIVAHGLLPRCTFVMPPLQPVETARRWDGFRLWARHCGLDVPEHLVVGQTLAVRFDENGRARGDSPSERDRRSLRTRYMRTLHEMVSDRPFDYDSLDGSQNWILWFIFVPLVLITLIIAIVMR